MPTEYNQILRGELQQRLARGLEIKDKSPARTLDPTVQAVVLLEDLTKQSITTAPLERRCGGGEVIGAGVGFLGIVTLFNPAAAKQIVVVEEITFRVNGTGAVRWGLTTGVINEPEVNRPFFYDWRNGAPPIEPTSQLFAGAVAAADSISWIVGRLAQGSTTSPGLVPINGLVLLPGVGFQVAAETANLEFSVFFRWLEYST